MPWPPARLARGAPGGSPCSFASSPISHGTPRPTSSSSRSSASRRSQRPARRARPPHGRRAAGARGVRRAPRKRRYGTALAAPGELPVARLLAVAAAGPRGWTARRHAGDRLRAVDPAAHRPPGRHSAAVWLSPIAGAPRRRRRRWPPSWSCAAWWRAASSPRRSTARTRMPLPRCWTSWSSWPRGADAAAVGRSAERGRIMGEGANIARRLANRVGQRHHARRCWPTRPDAIAREHGPVDRRDRRAARRRAGDGDVPRGGPGKRQPAPDDRAALGRGGRRGTRWGVTSRWSARACASTRAASASSRPTRWKR